MAHVGQLSESLETFILEFRPLFMVKLGRVAEVKDEVIKDLVGSCLASFVFCGICLCRSGEMVDHD